jgi:transcription initiation factor IIE alpha subunit
VIEDPRERAEVDHFILDHIDSVPHLEALLLLWRQRSVQWTAEEIEKRLWIKSEDARRILQDLVREHLISFMAGEPECYIYRPGPDTDLLLGAVADAYRTEMIRISNMIHAKPSSAVRAFAQAFRFIKEQE